MYIHKFIKLKKIFFIMAKYLVETYYTCTFKVKHYLDDISNNQLEQLDNRDDGDFEILDVKFDKRNTKNLEKSTEKVDVKYNETADKISNNKVNSPNKIVLNNNNFQRKKLLKDLVCQTGEKDIYKRKL